MMIVRGSMMGICEAGSITWMRKTGFHPVPINTGQNEGGGADKLLTSSSPIITPKSCFEV
jgi:hypothetical protein